MTLDELRKESYFQQLSEGDQKFVLARCTGSDRTNAAHAAWTCANDASAKAMANKASKKLGVKWCIGKFMGTKAGHEIPSAIALGSWFWQKAQTITDEKIALSYAENAAKVFGYFTKPTDPTEKPTADDGDEAFEL